MCWEEFTENTTHPCSGCEDFNPLSQKCKSNGGCAREYTKPPLGIKPGYIATEQRIADLVAAMQRQIGNNKMDEITTILLKMWAKEIILQAELLEKLNKGQE